MKHKPVARQLESLLGGSWKAVREGFGWVYECSDGRIVRSYASPILEYDGYSDSKFNIFYSVDGGWTPLSVHTPKTMKGSRL